MRLLDKIDKKVSYRKQIARQHSCHKFFWLEPKKFISSSLITMHFFLLFFTLCERMWEVPKMGKAGSRPSDMGRI